MAFNPKASGLVTIRPCLLCKRIEPKATLHRCKSCTMSAHTGSSPPRMIGSDPPTACYGIVPLEDDESEDEEDLRDWLCELCDLESQDLLFHPVRTRMLAGRRLTAFRIRTACSAPSRSPRSRTLPLPRSTSSNPPRSTSESRSRECARADPRHSFIHLICAIWHPDVKFSKPILFSEIEGAALANFHGLDNVRPCAPCELR